MAVNDIEVNQEFVTDSESDLYTAPTSDGFLSARITGGLCTNPGGLDAELTIYRVKLGDAASPKNRYLPPKLIYSGRTDMLPEIAGAGLTLEAGDRIVVQSSAADTLSITLSIAERTE